MNWLKKYWAGLLLGLFAIGWLVVDQLHRRMHHRAHYTIGYVTGWHPTSKSSIHYDFRFMDKGSIYQGSSPNDQGSNTFKGARFVVKYDSIDPTINVGYFNLLIPESIRQAPANGWRKPPFPVPQWILTMGQKEK